MVPVCAHFAEERVLPFPNRIRRSISGSITSPTEERSSALASLRLESLALFFSCLDDALALTFDLDIADKLSPFSALYLAIRSANCFL
jgi:hypothetical protein